MQTYPPQMRWDQLVADLVQVTSKANLARRLNVETKEIGRWMKGVVPHPDNADAILRECKDALIPWRNYAGLMPAYNFGRSYDWNTTQGPIALPTESGIIPKIPTRFLDRELDSPFGIPASILTLNSDWVEGFASLGFDVITYKTVRTRVYPSHPSPNCVYLPALTHPQSLQSFSSTTPSTVDTPTLDPTQISLANSFGMPSTSPEEWQRDIRITLSRLAKGQALIVSVVGTVVNGMSLEDDFVRCAELAWEVGPHAIELNFSCPNVYAKEEGSIYQDATRAGLIARRVRKALPHAKILIKIGHLTPEKLSELFEATYRLVDGYTAINTIPMKVVCVGQREEAAFPSSYRARPGVSGVAVRDLALNTVRQLKVLAEKKRDIVIVGVGGVSTADHAKSLLAAGADVVQVCTAAIFNPTVAIEMRKRLAFDQYSRAQSQFLAGAGQRIPFQDPLTARAFDDTLAICDELSVPFEVGYRALQAGWLNGYLRSTSNLQSSNNSMVKTRRESPTKDQIRDWIRREALKTDTGKY